jgi:hypothetical protein
MQPTTFSSFWIVAIKGLTVDGGLLSLDNSEWKARFGPGGKWVDKKDEFIKLAALFVGSLADDGAPASAARALLVQLRSLFRKPTDHPNASNFPSQLYNCLLEFISAKQCWVAGFAWPLPGPGINEPGTKKPDYLVLEHNSVVDGQVGDHVRAASPKTEPALIVQITSDLGDKLNTYKDSHVRVIIDASASEAVAVIGDHSRGAWGPRIAQAVANVNPQDRRARLVEVILIVAQDGALSFKRGTDF